MLIGSVGMCGRVVLSLLVPSVSLILIALVNGATTTSDVLIIRHGRSRVRHSTELRWGLKALDNLTLGYEETNSTEAYGFNGTEYDVGSGNGVANASLLTDDLEELERSIELAERMTESTIRDSAASLPVTSRKKVRKKEIMANIRKDVDKGLEYLRAHGDTIDATVSLIDVKIKRAGATAPTSSSMPVTHSPNTTPTSSTGSPTNSGTNSLDNKWTDDIVRQLISAQQAKLVKPKKVKATSAAENSIYSSIDNNQSIAIPSKNNRSSTGANFVPAAVDNVNTSSSGNEATTQKRKTSIHADEYVDDDGRMSSNYDAAPVSDRQGNTQRGQEKSNIDNKNLLNNKNSNYDSDDAAIAVGSPMEFNSDDPDAVGSSSYDVDASSSSSSTDDFASSKVSSDSTDESSFLLNDIDVEEAATSMNGGFNSVYQMEEINFDDLDEVSRANRKSLIKGQDVVTTFLRIVESQHLLGANCTAGTALNLGEGVVDRYAQDRFRVEAEIAVNRANMLTR